MADLQVLPALPSTHLQGINQKENPYYKQYAVCKTYTYAENRIFQYEFSGKELEILFDVF